MDHEKRNNRLTLSVTDDQNDFLEEIAESMSRAIHMNFNKQDVICWMVDEFKGVTRDRWEEWGK